MTDTTKMAAHLWDADIQRNRADRLAAMVETRDATIKELGATIDAWESMFWNAASTDTEFALA